MPDPVNEKLLLATNFVLHTNQTIFLTGRAGTGKTTFLHQIRQSNAKRLAVVAPTGVAAINAGGVTIHSLFQLPFGPIVPGAQQESRRFSREKISLLRTLDLLVIDEISMVRADVLDGIDDVLRRYRGNGQPFGGVQLLLIGDMQQLPPVIRDDDWNLLSPHYETGYFFGSRALRQMAYVAIELTHIYRQSDQRFIDLLNGVREKNITQAQFAELNQRYIPDFQPADEEGYITLSTHNNTAQQINSQKLLSLKTKLHTLKATTEGEFPESMYPTDGKLDLKVGAQVMFIKNDISREKLFYNGKIGRITAIDNDIIHVKAASDGQMIYAARVDWENIRYTIDPVTKEIKGDVVGRFTQYPLRLAWAITIHKSQGLTFEKAIIDASAAFAHGQVYVALSRCKTLGGLVLRTPIPSSSIKTEQTLENFHEQVQQQTPTEQHLHDAKRSNQESLLQDLFSFETAHALVYRCRRVVNEYGGSFSGELMPLLTQLTDDLQTKARDVSRRFVQQLPTYFAQDALPEANEPLQERIRKAGPYFGSLLADELLPLLRQCPTDSDNKQVRDSLLEALDELEKELFSKSRCFTGLTGGFDALAYLQTRNLAELDFRPERRKAEASASADSARGNALYGALMKWRNEKAGEHGASAYMVLPQKTIVELARLRPTTTAGLLAIKGFGKTKIKQIGHEVLAIIEAHTGGGATSRLANSAAGSPAGSVAAPKPKKDKDPKGFSQVVTLAFFRDGKSIADIAEERGLAVSTVESHLAQAVSAGELRIDALLPPAKVSAIRAYLTANKAKTLGEAKHALGENVTHSEVRFVYNAMRAEEA